MLPKLTRLFIKVDKRALEASKSLSFLEAKRLARIGCGNAGAVLPRVVVMFPKELEFVTGNKLARLVGNGFEIEVIEEASIGMVGNMEVRDALLITEFKATYKRKIKLKNTSL